MPAEFGSSRRGLGGSSSKLAVPCSGRQSNFAANALAAADARRLPIAGHMLRHKRPATTEAQKNAHDYA